jgi:succinate-semialdehyde dehydrogenase/glutarate-semialdehyde dehydrogenase
MGNKLGPALLCGNTVVVKPADTTPLTDVQCCAILTEAGLPPGVLNCVTGRGSIIGQELLTNPKVRKIGFTGSTDTGKMVMRAAAETIKRVTLELGGSDPMIVCDDADIDKAVSAASSGRFFNCGQACLAVKRLYVFERVADEFIGKLTAKVKRLVVGDGAKRETMVGPLHTAAQRKEIEEQVEDAKSRGAKVLAGGARPRGAEFEHGHFYLPTLLTDVPYDAKVSVEETFGPVLPVWRVKDLDEAIARANASIFGLGSSIWTRDLARATKGAEKIQAGYTWINSAQIIYDELPFGGMKQSGMGKEHGIEALDHYLETKSVVVANP